MDATALTKPRISVLIPAYNAAATIRACLWSVLNQSYTDFEVIVYCDGCDDETADIVNAIDDHRIVCHINRENKGIVNARNELIRLAKGAFIVWLDADDIALPGRLASQLEFMEVHPHLMVLGTWVEVRNNRVISEVRWPGKSEIVDAWMFFRNPLVQSSIMLRNVRGAINYSSDFEYLEDYYFYTQFLGKGVVAIYPEVLCSYLEDSEKSRIDKYLKYNFVGKLEQIMALNFARLDLNPGKNELALIREFLRNSKKLKAPEYRIVYNFLQRCRHANHKKNIFEKEAFDSVIGIQLLRLAMSYKAIIPSVGFYFLLHPLQFFGALSARVKYLQH